MGRSYLFTGRDTEHLSPAERQLEQLYDQIDRPGYRLSPTQFFQLPQTAELMDQLYGGLTDRIPPGSQIVQQTPGKVTYKDPQGFEHTITRKPDGQFTEATNRPSIVPSETAKGQQDFAQQLQQRLQQSLNDPATLAQLDPETAKSLAAISQAEQAANSQQLGDLQGQLLARLFGNGVNRSSIATNAGARFAQQAGLVQQQQQADAANRELSVRNLLTTLGQQQRALNTDLYANLTGQANQREIAGAGLDIDLKKLAEGSRQFDATNYLQQLQQQLEQEKFDASKGGFNKFLGVLNAASGLAQGAAGGLGAYKALTGGK